MEIFGVWSEEAGGFIAGPFYTRGAADSELEDLSLGGSGVGPIGVLEMCPEHLDEEQPKIGCESCDV